MTRKTRTIITLEVTVPQPPGYTQKTLLDWMREVLRREGSPFKSFETQIRVTGRSITYLTPRELSSNNPREVPPQ